MNRQIAPEIKPIQSIHTGFPNTIEKFIAIPSEDGVFKLDIIFPNAGYGLYKEKFSALYAMDLILSGTQNLSADQIAESIDLLGGFVFKTSDYYQSSITVYGLEDQKEALLKIIQDAYSNCIYPKDELDYYKQRKISDLNINLEKTSYLAGRGLNQLIFGQNHPFSKSHSAVEIEAINSESLLEYKTTQLKDPYFIYTGSNPESIKLILKQLDYKIEGSIDTKTEDPSEFDTFGTSEILLKGSTQNSIRMGKRLPSREHKDYFTLSLCNLILGGYFGSRLMKNIREEKGLTYGIHSSISPFKTFCYFRISSECNNTLTETVKEEIFKEIIKLQTELIEEEELSTAKNYMIGNLLRNFDGAYSISDRLKGSLELGTENPDLYYQSYFSAIQAIGSEEIRDCANNYFKIDSLLLCTAGEI